jgi:hypothetical protein
VLNGILRKQRQGLHPQRSFQSEIANAPGSARAFGEFFQFGGMSEAAALRAT